ASTGVFGNGLGNITLPGTSAAHVAQISVSKSLSALTSFEINPLWGLDGVPENPSDPNTTGTIDVSSDDYLNYYGRRPTGALPVHNDVVNRWELANMEMFWLKKGRIEYGATGHTEIHEGIFGEANLVEWMRQNATSLGVAPIAMHSPSAVLPDGSLGINLFPYPGYFNRDDNRNSNFGGRYNLAGGTTLAFGHPLSVSGRGRMTVANDPTVLNRFSPRQVDPTETPMTWLQYDSYDFAGIPEWTRNNFPATGDPFLAGTPLTTNYRAGQLFQNPGSASSGDEYYVDDPTELVLEPRNLQRPADEALRTTDSAYLQLAKSDIDSVGVHSRVRDLMPGNIDANDTSVDAKARRNRFTTSSWDRKQYSFPLLMDVGPDGRPGNAGQDDNSNGRVDDFGELGTGDDSGQNRQWEFNVDIDQDGLKEFPPEFPDAGPTAQWSSLVHNDTYEQGKLPQVPQDPFRPELRRLLEIEFGNRSDLKLQFPLSVNQLLDVQRVDETGGHSIYSALQFRPLTPHSTDGSLAASGLPTIAPEEFLPPPNSSNAGEREFWARYDRQRMARDIYVLLYTLGGRDIATPNRDYTRNPNYTLAQLQEMAQFAVNLIDSVDPDGVITVFEYDTDLSDGWDLDDQHWTDDGGDRAVVAGTEAQQLTFSETLWVFQPELANDNTFTPFDETSVPASASTDPGFHFTQIELRNVSPRSVPLAKASASTTAATASWRIRWQDTTDAGDINVVEESTNNVTDGNGFFFQAHSGGGTVDTVSAGELFTIASSNNTAPGSSDLFVDYDSASADHELIAPRFGTGPTSATGSPTGLTPNAHLDLVHSGHTSRFVLANGSPGDFLSGNHEPSSPSNPPLLVLERRANPDLPQLSVAQNPWIPVDYSQLVRRTLVEKAAASSGSPTQDDTRDGYTGMGATETDGLVNATSRHRTEPLNGESEANHSGGSDPYRANSMLGTTLAASTSYQVVQIHLDREFASLTELMDITLASPLYSTRGIVNRFSAY
ncbi:MAG: hypothetical protein ACYTGL_30950, partial [Planctomycetota bacterium]